MQVRLPCHAALGPHFAEVELITVDPWTPAGPPDVVDRSRAGHAEQPRLERTRPLETTERLVATEHCVPRNVLGVAASDDRRHVGDEASPLVIDHGREDRVQIGGR